MAEKARDDLELLFGFYNYAGKLPVSHFFLLRPSPKQKNISSEPQMSLKEISPGTAYLKISSFSGSSLEPDSLMKHVIDGGFEHLIIDLRNNKGGSVEAGMALARKLFDSSFNGGVFLTRKWFSEHPDIPTEKEYGLFPIFNQANYHLILEGIHHEKGLVLQVVPDQPVFKGQVYILVNRQTASTCEPLVHALQLSGRARIIGETTAGAMLNAEFFPLSGGFSIVVPTADYYTKNGFHIDGKGVSPDIYCKDQDPLERVLHEMIGIK